MKQIPLTQHRLALVDDEDFEWLNQFKWCVNSSKYVITGKNTMHKMIMNPPKDMQIDHVNGDRFDNRRINLRICTGSQNCMNRKPTTKGISGYRGVTWHSTTQKWRARIELNGIKISLGLFLTPEEAAQAYNQATKQYFGEFAFNSF